LEQRNSHQITLTVINAFTALCLGVLFAYNLQRGLLWFGVKQGAWQTPFVTIVYLVSFLISWKIIKKASVGVAEAPVAELAAIDPAPVDSAAA